MLHGSWERSEKALLKKKISICAQPEKVMDNIVNRFSRN